MERADGVAVFIIISLSLALLAYGHLTVGFVDYGLLFLCIICLCVIYLLAFLLALALSGSLRVPHRETRRILKKDNGGKTEYV
ncbi:MAG: hypothetical protein OEX76_06350 [Candidatus Bathyarchaeota archaeon]|nr:hypothetical protein [Candidatus Bathyarchaeota archaeon]